MNEKTAKDVNHGFCAGNYANAYETEDLEVALERLDSESPTQAYRDAFIIGFFGSYEVWEIPSDCLDEFMQAFWGQYGEACVTLGYCDARPAEDWRKAGFDV